MYKCSVAIRGKWPVLEHHDLNMNVCSNKSLYINFLWIYRSWSSKKTPNRRTKWGRYHSEYDHRPFTGWCKSNTKCKELKKSNRFIVIVPDFFCYTNCESQIFISPLLKKKKERKKIMLQQWKFLRKNYSSRKLWILGHNLFQGPILAINKPLTMT